MFLQRTTIGLLALSFGFASCSKDSDDATPAAVQLRTKMDYATLTATTPYTTTFKDGSGTATVDLGASSTRLDMISEMDTYLKTVTVTTSTPAALDIAKLNNQYKNTAGAFSAATLNTSGVQLRDQTGAATATGATAAQAYMDAALTKVATASQSVANTATAGNAGRLGKYLVDANGIEQGQVIQKAFIGALLLDQVDNVLLSDASLNADNSAVVTGKTYTALEHNWDLAYSYLTKNPVMTQDFTSTPKELFLASYLNEKNTANSPKVYMAFLKGRAAIINNDKTTLLAQADIIRTELEKTIALGATTYLASWKAGTDLPTKAHALGEGLGFIYSLRFCTTKYKADAAFSDAQLNTLLPAAQANGAWSLTNAQADAVIAAVTAKFSL